MGIEIRKVKTTSDKLKYLRLAVYNEHLESDFDEGYEAYATYVLTEPNLQMYLAYDDVKPVGYFAFYKIALRSELMSFDWFILPDYRGGNIVHQFSSTIISAAFEQGIKRIRFATNVLPQRFFERIAPVAVRKDYEMYFVDMSDFRRA